jgi:hypothetical protein
VAVRSTIPQRLRRRLMNHPTVEQLGPPSVRLAALHLWVHGRQLPDAQDKSDGNWLDVTTHCGQAGASVWATGAILDTVGLLRLRDGLERLRQTLAGEAVLESHERNIVVRVAATDGTGHLRERVEITPDHLAQCHWFEFEIDQSYLPAAVAQLDSVLVAFPVRGMCG